MFEQSVLPNVPAKRPYTFVLVTVAELAGLALIVVAPLFFIPVLVPPKLPVVVRFVHAVVSIKLDNARSGPVASRQTFVPRRVFYAPTHIPTQIAKADALITNTGAPDVGTGPALGSTLGVPDGLDLTGSIVPVPAPPKPATPKPTNTAPIHVSSGVQEAKLINRVIPHYPRLAIQTRQSGKVHLIATIGTDGRVKQIQVVNGPALLVTAAVEAVKEWVYQPTLLNGKPVEVIAPIEVNFLLNQ
jgi:protein TonB